MRLPKLKGRLRKPTSPLARRMLASRDFLRRQQEFISIAYARMSGTQLFLIDSLTAGVTGGGSVQFSPPPYYVARAAQSDGRLGKFTTRATSEIAPATLVTISVYGNGFSTSLTSTTSPSNKSFTNTGVGSGDTIRIETSEFPWATARIYFSKQSGGGSIYGVSPEATSSVSSDGLSGEIGYLEVANTSSDPLSDIVIGGFDDGPIEICHIAHDTGATGDVVDVINFAFSGDECANFNTITNIQQWYAQFEPDHAWANLGTNDIDELSIPDVKLEIEGVVGNLLTYGIPASEITMIMPSDQTRTRIGAGQFLWDSAANGLGVDFVGLGRLYGDYDTFVANGWMNDAVHPNDTFNEIHGLAQYNLTMQSDYNKLDIGTQPHVICDNGTISESVGYCVLDSDVVLSGDFSLEFRFFYDTAAGSSVGIATDNSFSNDIYIRSDGEITIRLDGDSCDTPTGIVTESGWYTLSIERVGAVLTVDLNGAQIHSTDVVLTDVTFNRLMRSYTAQAFYMKHTWATFTDSTTTYQWLFNQPKDTLFIPALQGGVDGLWVAKQVSESSYAVYSVRADGNLINYYTLKDTGYSWGDAEYPSGTLNPDTQLEPDTEMGDFNV